MKITRYAIGPSQVPVDFLADPDGVWEFDGLVEAAGFNPDQRGIAVGALVKAFRGHPPGAAVVAEVFGARVAGGHGVTGAHGVASSEGAASLNGSAPRYSITGRYFAIIECEDVHSAVAASQTAISHAVVSHAAVSHVSQAVASQAVASQAVLPSTSASFAAMAVPSTVMGPLSYIGARTAPAAASVSPELTAELPTTPRHAA